MQGLFVAAQGRFGGLDGGGPVGDRESASMRLRPQHILISCCGAVVAPCRGYSWLRRDDSADSTGRGPVGDRDSTSMRFRPQHILILRIAWDCMVARKEMSWL